MGNVAFMILGWIEMCPRPVGSAFQRRTLRRYQASVQTDGRVLAPSTPKHLVIRELRSVA